MEHEYKPTMFDTQVHSQNLQIMKAMVPYLAARQQKPFAFMIKYMELQKTLEVFSSNTLSIQSAPAESEQDKMFHMLSDISEQCSEAEQENISMMLNMLQMLSAYESMQ